MMNRTILIAIDSSAPSRAALRWSVERASATKADLELIHVVDEEWMTPASAEHDRAMADARTVLDNELRYASSLDAAISIHGTIAEGRAPLVLADASTGYDLLVIGTHKTGFIYGRAFGSKFLGLAWKANCNVAFIPDLVGHTRRGVIAGVEDSDTGDTVIRFAAAEAVHTAQNLTLVSSWDSAPLARSRSERTETLAIRRTDLLTRAVALAKTSQAGVHVRGRAADHAAPEALLEASSGAALLVIGRRRTKPPGSPFRTNNYDVLNNMVSPVIVVLSDSVPALV